MSMPFYASAEQIMRDRSEYARKNVSRGRGVVVLKYPDGILLVAENTSNTLHKISEIYDRIAFAGVGKYNEYENLRVAGIRLADLRGYSYDRRDVTARALANAYAQTLGAIFTEQQKPYEVEICVAEVGDTADDDQLYRLTYDGTIVDEPDYLVMGGQSEAIATELRRELHRRRVAARLPGRGRVARSGSAGGSDGKPRELPTVPARGRRARPHPRQAQVPSHHRRRAHPAAAAGDAPNRRPRSPPEAADEIDPDDLP